MNHLQLFEKNAQGNCAPAACRPHMCELTEQEPMASHFSILKFVDFGFDNSGGGSPSKKMHVPASNSYLAILAHFTGIATADMDSEHR